MSDHCRSEVDKTSGVNYANNQPQHCLTQKAYGTYLDKNMQLKFLRLRWIAVACTTLLR